MPEWIGEGHEFWMRHIRRASEDVISLMAVTTMRGIVDAAEYRRLMVERMPGSAEFVRVCEKVVAEGKFKGGETEPEEAECELWGVIITAYFREAERHGWVIEA